jgi:phosphatidylglycerophosphate synthase
MNSYQPAWRRPIARAFRLTAVVPVEWCARHGVSANVVSYSSIAASLAAGVCFWQAGHWPALLIAAPLFCYVRLWLNMLDGMVALATGSASRTGEIANELPDRVSDVIIFVGVAHSGLCQPLCGYWAAILALLVAYVGTLGQAVGVQREFSGLMAKPWRMVALHVGAWVSFALLQTGNSRPSGLTVLDVTLLAIIGGCVQTVAIRLVRIVRAIHGQARLSATTGTHPEE